MKTTNCMNCRNHKDGLWCIECKYVPMDLVDVVRCKDCKWKADTIGESWCDFHEFTILSDDDFCSYGKRKDDDAR